MLSNGVTTSKENRVVTFDGTNGYSLTNEIHDTVYGLVLDGVASGATGTMRPWIAGDVYSVRVSAAVAINAKLQIDTSNAGELVTATTGPAVAVALEATSGAGNCLCIALASAPAISGVPAAVAVNATATQAAADIAPDTVITSTTASAVTYTTRTGTQLTSDHPLVQIGQGFRFSVSNTGASNAFTVTAGTDVTVTGGAVPANTKKEFFAKRTAATTWAIF